MFATKTATLGAIVLLLNALTAQAFHVESGTKCTNIGGSCSYISDDSSANGSAQTTVTGTCAPDGICASNGATCSDNDECYNYCGTDGICGGVGAGCNTQSTFEAGQSGIACGEGFSCSANGATGSCLQSAAVAAPGASQALRRNKRRIGGSIHARQARSADIRARSQSSRQHL